MKKKDIRIRIAELIGELRGKSLTINGQKNKVIIGTESLISFLEEIQKIIRKQK